jgi:hypothetical protein
VLSFRRGAGSWLFAGRRPARRLPRRPHPTDAQLREDKQQPPLERGCRTLYRRVLFPELRDSDRWRRTGYGLLEHGFARQVFSDGGYVQHSANYQRLALALGVWSARLAEVNGEPFPKDTLAAIVRLARSLAAQSDRKGRTSAFGPDDGSNPLPLSSTEAGDARPVVAAATPRSRRNLVSAGPVGRDLGLARPRRGRSQ